MGRSRRTSSPHNCKARSKTTIRLSAVGTVKQTLHIVGKSPTAAYGKTNSIIPDRFPDAKFGRGRGRPLCADVEQDPRTCAIPTAQSSLALAPCLPMAIAMPVAAHHGRCEARYRSHHARPCPPRGPPLGAGPLLLFCHRRLLRSHLCLLLLRWHVPLLRPTTPPWPGLHVLQLHLAIKEDVHGIRRAWIWPVGRRRAMAYTPRASTSPARTGAQATAAAGAPPSRPHHHDRCSSAPPARTEVVRRRDI